METVTAKFKKLDEKARYGGNVYEYRSFKIKDITSPNSSYGDWVVHGEYKNHRIWESGNTRQRVKWKLDATLARIDAQVEGLK